MVINFDINNNECRGDHMEKTKKELARYQRGTGTSEDYKSYLKKEKEKR